jgi:hypothetical protein
MSQFLVIGQPLNNLRLISEGEYRTTAQARYEEINSSNEFNFLNYAVISALALLVFASLTPPTPKKMAGFSVVVIAYGLIAYVASLPKKPALDDETQEIFQEMTRFVDEYAETKIKALQGLLNGVRIRNGEQESFADVPSWAKKLYDDFKQPFAIPRDHPHLVHNSDKNITLNPQTEEMRKNTSKVSEFADKIFRMAYRHRPSHLETQWRQLQKACEKLVHTPVWPRAVRSETDPTQLELRIPEPEAASNEF